MKRIVIIGGGFAGIHALRELAKNRDIEILMIDKHSYHYLQPQVYDLIANESTLADVTIDLFNLCQGFGHPNMRFQPLRVIGIDFEAKKIHTEEKEIVPYDYLILATGSRTAFPLNIEGIAKTNDIKKLHKALFFKQSYETEIFNKIVLEGRSCEPTDIVIVGAGLSGVEIAAEMAHYGNRFFRRGLFACSNMKITLISGSSTILPGMREKIIALSQKRLKDLGVEIITRTHMQKADEEFVYLDNGNKIRYSFVIYAGGIEASNITSALDLEKNKKGQIIVNEFLQTQRYPEVFVTGDSAEIRDKKGELCIPNVTTAKTSGIGAARNTLHLLSCRKPEPVYPELDGTLIALGGYYAVGDLYGKIALKGLLGYLIKQFVFFRYRFPLLKYLRNGYENFHRRR
ncbi:MAG: NAD(P)/FAD-dependent oxidoreductase [Sulfuricurvum sp.]|nr:NAD(P)/FAD-dependent oxidoreductase [Sulfuricurvum sp.]